MLLEKRNFGKEEMVCCVIASLTFSKNYLGETHITFQEFGGLDFVNYGYITMLIRIYLDESASTCYIHAKVYIMTILRYCPM